MSREFHGLCLPVSTAGWVVGLYPAACVGVDVLSLSRRGCFGVASVAVVVADISRVFSSAVRNWLCDIRPQLWIGERNLKLCARYIGVGMLVRNLHLVYHTLAMVNRRHVLLEGAVTWKVVQVSQKVRVLTSTKGNE
jgi:hypothetical protein